ncbi:hypothetical protein [Flexivirga oryzae]|uniref:hypothetical protein n=1 Tax=Flexivirga oryzae TaxID=1794944 RepID=UPI001607DA9D|nr:hypothetical protein [Flexivirga oryzae]
MFAMVGVVLAAIAYGAATILQAIGVRRMDAARESALRTRLWAGRSYAAGLLLDATGFVLSVVALRSLPLFMVESMLASSVGVTALLAVLVLRDRLSGREVVALVVTGIGLVLLAISAQEGRGSAIGRAGGWLLAGCGVLVGVVFAAGALDRRPARSACVLAAAAGLGFGLTGVAARVLVVSDPWWRTAGQPALWALVLGGLVGIVSFGFALDRGRTTTVAATTFVVETVVPAVVGLLWLGDSVRDGFAAAAVVGFVAALGGCLVLAGRAEIEV